MDPLKTKNSHRNVLFKKKKKIETQTSAIDVYPNAYKINLIHQINQIPQIWLLGMKNQRERERERNN